MNNGRSKGSSHLNETYHRVSNRVTSGTKGEAREHEALTELPWPMEMLPPQSLMPAQRNARTHSKKQIRQIADSIKRFGVINPLVADDHGCMIAGHARAEAAKLLGIKSVPVIRVSHLSEAEIRAYMLADNKLAEKSGWDRELLAIELSELTELFPPKASTFRSQDLTYPKSTCS